MGMRRKGLAFALAGALVATGGTANAKDRAPLTADQQMAHDGAVSLIATHL